MLRLATMKARAGRLVLLTAGVSVVAALATACSSDASNEETRSTRAALSYDSDNGGYCASNPSAECNHGTPVQPKQLVFTFDDGPGSQTLSLSSYLHAQGIRATFFVNGRNFGGDPASFLSQLVADGHLVGNHTQNHRDLTTLDDATILSELVETDNLIAPFVPDGHFLFDAPFGGWNAHVHSVLHASAMDKYVGPVKFDIGGAMTSIYGADWDCWQNQSGYGVQTTKQCGDRYLREIADVGRGIILLHDADYGDVTNHSLTSGRGNTIDMVKYMVEGDASSGVQGLKELGYTFIREDEVPDIAAAFQGTSGGGTTDGGAPGGGSCAFDPTWAQTSYANEWWAEYSITGNVSSASLEIVGGPTVTLSSEYGKWIGPTGDRIPTGTQVIVHATDAAGQGAQTQPFPYLVTTTPLTACGGACIPSCANRACGDDGCGGSCGTCSAGTTCSAGACVSSCSGSFSPTWTQTSYANEWWIEYVIATSTTVKSAYLEIEGGPTVPLSSQYGKWIGPTDVRIPRGTSVVVHAENTLGEIAATSPFAYLDVTSPPTAPCSN